MVTIIGGFVVINFIVDKIVRLKDGWSQRRENKIKY